MRISCSSLHLLELSHLPVTIIQPGLVERIGLGLSRRPEVVFEELSGDSREKWCGRG